MKNTLFFVCMVSICINCAIYPISFKSFYSIFAAEKYEEVEQKEIPAGACRSIKIENIKGPIHIQGWQQPKILLKATKRATKQESLAHISINIHSSNDHIDIKTVFANETTIGSVDYHLLVPETINITVDAKTSLIKVEHSTGAVTAHNEQGNIELLDIRGPIDVAIGSKGSIMIEQPGNSIKATTLHGTIDIHDAKKSIFASSDNGKIRASSKLVTHGSIIQLDASGPITLQLPSEVNADIQAETEQGNITCEHYVTIKPFITQLNSKSWTQFKRMVNGTFGSGGAHISLHSVSGNIKITKSATTT